MIQGRIMKNLYSQLWELRIEVFRQNNNLGHSFRSLVPGVTYVQSEHKTDVAHPSLICLEVRICQHFADQPKRSDAYDPVAVDIVWRVHMAENEFISELDHERFSTHEKWRLNQSGKDLSAEASNSGGTHRLNCVSKSLDKVQSACFVSITHYFRY